MAKLMIMMVKIAHWSSWWLILGEPDGSTTDGSSHTFGQKVFTNPGSNWEKLGPVRIRGFCPHQVAAAKSPWWVCHGSTGIAGDIIIPVHRYKEQKSGVEAEWLQLQVLSKHLTSSQLARWCRQTGRDCWPFWHSKVVNYDVAPCLLASLIFVELWLKAKDLLLLITTL